MRQFCPLGNIWQCLHAFLVFTTWRGEECHWHIMAEDKDAANYAKIKMHRTGHYSKWSDSESQQWRGWETLLWRLKLPKTQELKSMDSQVTEMHSTFISRLPGFKYSWPSTSMGSAFMDTDGWLHYATLYKELEPSVDFGVCGDGGGWPGTNPPYTKGRLYPHLTKRMNWNNLIQVLVSLLFLKKI